MIDTPRTIPTSPQNTPKGGKSAHPAPLIAQPPRIALAHDWLCGYRGGEAVLERIANIIQSHFTPAPLYTMFDNGRPLTPTVDTFKHIASDLNRLPGASGRLRRWLMPLYPHAVANLGQSLLKAHARDPIHLLISTSSAAIKGLRPPPGTPHICYCHSPARYVWSRRAEYARGRGPANLLRGVGLWAISTHFKNWDRATSENVSHFIANSTHTANEIRRCYNRQATIIHPPVRTNLFTPDPSIKRESFWLVVSALEPYKRIDLAIQAANITRHRLIVIGTGSQKSSLQAAAGPTVEFLGRVDDATVVNMYRRAQALLFPQVEDFGIVAAEALSCGLPVIARKAGGALDIIQDGTTGALFEEPTAQAIVQAAKNAPPDCAEKCRKSALKFSEDDFDRKIKQFIQTVLDSTSSRDQLE